MMHVPGVRHKLLYIQQSFLTFGVGILFGVTWYIDGVVGFFKNSDKNTK